MQNLTLIFLSLPFFLAKARKTTQNSKDFHYAKPLKFLGRRENAQKSKEIPCNEKNKEIQKNKERKIGVVALKRCDL